MSDHTPTYEDMEIEYGLDKHFRWWLQARESRIEAAAEQRGAEPFINIIERVAEHPSLIGTQTAQDIKQLLDSIQANHTEGDDETR